MAIGSKERARLVFVGGPLDGSAEERSEAPPVVVWRVAAEREDENGDWPQLMHRYRRETDCGKGGRVRIWIYRHEGSVLA